jgi:hypothetical protein
VTACVEMGSMFSNSAVFSEHSTQTAVYVKVDWKYGRELLFMVKFTIGVW